MKSALRVVTRIPLDELWSESGAVVGVRGAFIDAEDIAGMLRDGMLQFVVADVARKLNWVNLSECYEFWNAEVKPHLAEAGSKPRLDDFPEGYFYFGSRWTVTGSAPIVLLEKHH